MKNNVLKLPCSELYVLVNGIPTSFEFTNSDYNSYFLDDKEITILGCIDIFIDPEEFTPGDIIEIYSSAGKLEYVGGGEGTVNAVSELEKYIFAIGVPDTPFIEWNYGSLVGDITEIEKGYRYHVLSYELLGRSDTGFSFKILQGINNKSYSNGKLHIRVAWESNEHSYAWKLADCLTS